MSTVEQKIDAPIMHAVFIRASCEEAYDAFTRSERINEWFTSGAELDPTPGGRLYFRWADWGPDKINCDDNGTVLEAERPSRFVYQWFGEWRTTVRLTFEEADGGTVVRVAEEGFPDTENGRRMCLDCATGWGEALTLLKFYVEGRGTY